MTDFKLTTLFEVEYIEKRCVLVIKLLGYGTLIANSGGSTGGEGGDRPPRLGPKKIS